MTLFDRINGKYRVTAKCSNCGVVNEITIPKGMRILNFFKTKYAVCSHCGCTIDDLKDILQKGGNESYY